MWRSLLLLVGTLMSFAGCAAPPPLALPRPPASVGIASTAMSVSQTSAPTAAVTASVAPGDSGGVFAPAATAQAGATTVVVVPNAGPTPTNDRRWEMQRDQWQPFAPEQRFTVAAPTALRWYDPTTGQTVDIGFFSGEVSAQGAFRYRPTGEQALQVRYTINRDFGLTSISGALRDRFQTAGYPEQIDAFIVRSDAVMPTE